MSSRRSPRSSPERQSTPRNDQSSTLRAADFGGVADSVCRGAATPPYGTELESCAAVRRAVFHGYSPGYVRHSEGRVLITGIEQPYPRELNRGVHIIRICERYDTTDATTSGALRHSYCTLSDTHTPYKTPYETRSMRALAALRMVWASAAWMAVEMLATWCPRHVYAASWHVLFTFTCVRKLRGDARPSPYRELSVAPGRYRYRI
jgi:hypothetical protein